MQVYLNAVMLLNGLVDFLLLLGANRLTGFPPGGKRAAVAAAFGSLYSGVCLLPRFRFLGNILWRLVTLCAMAVLAFGWNRSAIRRGGVFLLLNMALGGLAQGMETTAGPALLLGAVGLWLLCRFLFDSGMEARQYVPLELAYGGRKIQVIALRDTGNTLRDPVTGEQVLILSAAASSRLTGLTARQLAQPLETLSKRPIPGLRLIPYRTVGRANGLLLGLRVERIRIGNQEHSGIVAFSPEGLGAGDQYQALTGGMV